MEAITKPTWPQSWREKMDRMEIGESEPVDQRVVKSVRYIASKHFHSAKARSKKRFTVKKIRCIQVSINYGERKMMPGRKEV